MMNERETQALDLSVLPLNRNVITIADKLIVMDNLDDPFPGDAQVLKDRFPMKLALSCIIVVVQGSVRLGINLRDIAVEAGSCAVIASGAIIERISIDDGARVIMLSFAQTPGFESMLQRIEALQAARVVLLPGHLDMLVATYRMLRTIMTEDSFDYKRNEVARHCMNLIAGIIAQGANRQVDLEAKPSRGDEIVTRFLQCVADNYRQHRELSFYAGQLGLSLKYMSHVIFQQTGRHPSHWIKDYVILDAKTMLRSGRYSVQQVAEELNFPNQSFFGKYFKEAVGISPKKWK